jgi:CHAD domain-containing protein
MPQPAMRQYARRRTALLLHRFSGQVTRAAEAMDADVIHDLRVSIRRFSRCLRVFAAFYPRDSWRPIRRQLSGLMHLAGAVRDCDIALELLQKAGVSERSAIARQLQVQRRQASQGLQTEARLWKAQAVTRQWRKQLEV